MSRSCFGLLLAVVVGLLAQPLEARERDKQRRGSQGLEPHGLSDERHAPGQHPQGASIAAEMAVRANGGGRVLSVRRVDGGYRVKVLKDGEVRTHHITVE